MIMLYYVTRPVCELRVWEGVYQGRTKKGVLQKNQIQKKAFFVYCK